MIKRFLRICQGDFCLCLLNKGEEQEATLAEKHSRFHQFWRTYRLQDTSKLSGQKRPKTNVQVPQKHRGHPVGGVPRSIVESWAQPRESARCVAAFPCPKSAMPSPDRAPCCGRRARIRRRRHQGFRPWLLAMSLKT